MKFYAIAAIVFLVVMVYPATASQRKSVKTESVPAIVLAVEFNSHAACAHIAQHKGLFEAEGVQIKAFDNYATGTALAAGLVRGDVDAAYICLIPAINVFVNGEVPIKVVAGTHKYGYALVVDPTKVHRPEDLAAPGVRISCAREGTPTDILLHKIIDIWKLDEKKIIPNVRRMSPPKQLTALRAGQIDAAFLPEQYPQMAEKSGFTVLVTAQDVWPHMQGSVLVTTDDLIQSHPEVVEKLVKITKKATDWINAHPQQASVIVAQKLNGLGLRIFPEKEHMLSSSFTITPEVVNASLVKGIVCSTDIELYDIEEAMAYLDKLGYLRRQINPEKMLDRTWLSK